MTPDDLHGILTTSGISSRVRRDEVVIETCLFCGNTRWNLELNAEKGVYWCWACREGGRLSSLLQTVTGKSHHIPVQMERDEREPPTPTAPTEFSYLPVEMVYPAARYLARRGITEEMIRRYGLAVCVEPGHLLEGRIVIPARDFWTSALVGWVGRTYLNTKPKYLSTVPRSAVTGWRAGRAPVVIVEGHLDGIAVHLAGYSAAVLGGTNAQDVAEFAGRVPVSNPIVVMLDGSARDESRRLYWSLVAIRGEGMVRQVLLDPGIDPSKVGSEVLRELLARNKS